MGNSYKKLVSLSIFFVITLAIFAQKKLPESVQFQIDNYKNNAIKNRNIGNDNTAAMYLNKIAFLYWEYFIYDEAILHFEEVLKINQDGGNIAGQKKVLDNMAFVYSDMERYDKAIECFLKSHEFYKKAKVKNDIAGSFSNIALAYSNNGQAKKAIQYADEGLAIAKNINNIKLMRSFYGILYEAYNKLGNKQKSIEYFGLYSSIDKHIQQALFQEREKQSKAQLSQMKTEKDAAVYEKTEKERELKYTQDSLKQRQLAIDLLNAENEAKEAKLKAKEAELQAERRLLLFAIIIVLVLFAFAFFVYVQMRQKRKANLLLHELNKEVEKKNVQILDSINYASHIQEAILPYKKQINDQIEESFIFYRPKDIVSGDFYWYSSRGDMVFIAAIDCTGHGVPGAFMSMIGNTLLNEIVNEREITKPAEVLKMLNEKVVFTLNQDKKDEEGFSEDGMDITFCTYNKSNDKLEIALANHTATIIKNNELQLLEGDIFSIGGNVGDFSIEFTNHEISIDTDTLIYMYSDGYQDQFGGNKHQKFMASRFTKLLKKIHTMELKTQEQMIKSEFDQWRGSNKQIDDLLVIGLKLIPQKK